jgi:hypothetical protein
MARTTLRRARRTRDVETLSELHTALVRERQQLRSLGAETDELESNRLAIVHCQWELSWALIERYLPRTAAPTAA